MPGFQDESHLEEAIKTTLMQLCKLGTFFQTELLIEGTIGLTIDKKKVILVHFQDRTLTPDSQMESAALTSIPNSVQIQASSAAVVSSTLSLTAAGPQSTVSPENELCNLKLLGNTEALSSLQDIFTRPLVQPTSDPKGSSRGKQRTLSDTPCKEVTVDGCTTIDLDSDNESFSAMNFGGIGEVKVKGGLLAKGTAADIKNAIVIDDDFFDTAPMDSTYCQDNISVSETIGEVYPHPQATCDNADSVSVASVDVVPPTSKDTESLPVQITPTKASLQCNKCSKNMSTQSALEAHMVAVHEITETTFGKISHYSCETCGKMFRFKAALKKHEYRHVTERPYKCKVCDASYNSESSLNVHVNVHANRFKCDMCNKSYGNKKLFQKHIRYKHENAT